MNIFFLLICLLLLYFALDSNFKLLIVWQRLNQGYKAVRGFTCKLDWIGQLPPYNPHNFCLANGLLMILVHNTTSPI